MKVMIKVFFTLVLLIMVVSCATTPRTLPEKYNLDNELEAVNKISTFKVSRWEEVDNQSVILRVNYNDYYLLVLRRPIYAMTSRHRIGISSTVSTITSGVDRIHVRDNTGTQYYDIEKIYKLEGKEQKEDIKERLRKD